MTGIISERDTVRKMGLQDKDFTEAKVKETFIPPPRLTMPRPKSSLAECFHLIHEYDLYRFPILDDAADFVGMVSV